MLSGVCGDGFKMKVLPQLIAVGRNQSGTINGKLKGVIAAKTPAGCRTVVSSMPELISSKPVAAHQNRHTHGEVDTFDTTAHFSARFVHRLAILAHDNLRNLFEVVFNHHLEVVHVLRAHQHGRAAPLYKGGFGCARCRIDILARRIGAIRQRFAGSPGRERT